MIRKNFWKNGVEDYMTPPPSGGKGERKSGKERSILLHGKRLNTQMGSGKSIRLNVVMVATFLLRSGVESSKWCKERT